MDINEERELIEEAKNGSISAYEKLIAGYHQKIFNIAFYYTRNKTNASDLTQDVFIKIFRSLKDYRSESSFYTWVYRIARNTFINEYKKSYYRKEITAQEFDSSLKIESDNSIRDPDKETEQKIFREELHKCIALLPYNFRFPLILYDLQGFSYEEISRITNTALGTVKSRINRARLILAEILEKTDSFKEYI